MNITNLKHFKAIDKFGFVKIVKYAIVFMASFVIYSKLDPLPSLEIQANSWTVLLILLLTVLNWHFEILKWKVLVQKVRSISYFEALAQSLAAHTAAITTPNKLGEYGAKAYYFKDLQPKRIMVLNFTGNAYQLLTTLCFGSYGLTVYLKNNTALPFRPWIVFAAYSALLFTCLFYLLCTKSYRKHFQHFKEIGLKVHFLTFAYSCIRYLVFSCQFFLILFSFEPEIRFTEIIPVIWCMYLIASFIPGFSLVDFALKGSVALVLLASFPMQELSIMSTALLMWMCNFGIPAGLGMYFVLRTQPYKSVST